MIINQILENRVSTLFIQHQTADNKVDYAVVYGEFRYAALSWGQTRRVAVKVEKAVGQLVYLHTFIVTNMESEPSEIIRFYCNRGRMENFIKESKNGFNMGSMSSSKMIINSNRMQISALVYNLFNWFRQLVAAKDNEKAVSRYHSIEAAKNCCKSGTFTEIYHIQTL